MRAPGRSSTRAWARGRLRRHLARAPSDRTRLHVVQPPRARPRCSARRLHPGLERPRHAHPHCRHPRAVAVERSRPRGSRAARSRLTALRNLPSRRVASGLAPHHPRGENAMHQPFAETGPSTTAHVPFPDSLAVNRRQVEQLFPSLGVSRYKSSALVALAVARSAAMANVPMAGTSSQRAPAWSAVRREQQEVFMRSAPRDVRTEARRRTRRRGKACCCPSRFGRSRRSSSRRR